MTVPFTDAPLSCATGRHLWDTYWTDEEGPMAACRRCGSRLRDRREARDAAPPDGRGPGG